MLFRRNKEAAFSNYRLWESAGFVIAYAYSTTLCARMKLYVLFGNLCIGVICYIIVEIRHRRKVRTGWCTLNVATDGNNFFFVRFHRNDDSRNRRPKMRPLVKPNWPPIKSKRPTTNETIWKMTLKLLISNRTYNYKTQLLCDRKNYKKEI